MTLPASVPPKTRRNIRRTAYIPFLLATGLALLISCDSSTEPPVAVATIAVSPLERTLVVGDTAHLEATLRNAKGSVLDGHEVVWTSSDPGVADVDPEGLVTAIAGSEAPATITATSAGKQASASITVRVPAASIEIAPEQASLFPGDTLRLNATLLDAEGNALEDREVVWTSSDPGVADVDAEGLITAVAAGEAAVTISAASEGSHASASVTVLAPVASIHLSPIEASLAPGDTLRFAAVPRDSEGNALESRTIAWASSNGAVASVDSSGLVKAIADGTVSITATAGSESATAILEVVTPAVSIVVGPDTLGVLVNGSDQLEATLYAENGAPLSGRTVEWSSSDPEIVAVDSAGRIQGVAIGVTTVTAASEGIVGSALVEVDTVRQTGASALCALTPDGQAYCWGPNENGQVGDGTTEVRLSPTAVAGDLKFSQIANSVCMTIALTPEGVGYAWGSNHYGSLGVGDGDDRSVPTPVAGGLTFTWVSQACGYTTAIGTDGQLYHWGAVPTARSEFYNAYEPEVLSSAITFVRAHQGIGLTAEGDVYTWGSNRLGQLGLGIEDDDYFAPTPVPALLGEEIVAIQKSSQTNIALSVDGRLFLWGETGGGMLGDGTFTSHRSSPTAVAGDLRFKAIASNGATIHGITVSGELYGWGVNIAQQIGTDIGRNTHWPSPIHIVDAPRFYAVQSGFGNWVHATTASGRRYSWGYNGSASGEDQTGMLGLGDMTDRGIPTPLPAEWVFRPDAIPH